MRRSHLKLLKKEPFRREKLLENAAWFRDELKAAGFEVRGQSQIVPLIIDDTERLLLLSRRLRDAGFWVLPIRPPTVPAGQSRLRFSLTYCHDKSILQRLITQIDKANNV